MFIVGLFSPWSIKCVAEVPWSREEAAFRPFSITWVWKGLGKPRQTWEQRNRCCELRVETLLCGSQTISHLFVSGIWSQFFGNMWKLFKLAVWAVSETGACSWAGFCHWCLSEWRLQLACLGSGEHVLTQMWLSAWSETELECYGVYIDKDLMGTYWITRWMDVMTLNPSLLVQDQLCQQKPVGLWLFCLCLPLVCWYIDTLV